MTALAALAATLSDAALAASAVPQLSLAQELTLEDAYAVQRAGIELRSARGDRPVGLKLGFTSRAKAEQMGVHDVIVGVLTARMQVPDGDSVDRASFIHPRIEPEIAFRLGRAVDLSDPTDDLADAVIAIAPALEIIDSRYRDFSFSLADVVADNTSAAAFVVGAWQGFGLAGGGTDVSNLGVVLEVDGRVVETGSTAAILGNPLRALDSFKRMARLHGLELPSGSVLLAGAATAAVPLTSGSVVEASVTGLGRVSVRVSGGTHD